MKKFLITLLIGFLTLGFVGIASSDELTFSDEIENMSIVKDINNYDIITITTKDGKCFMYKMRKGEQKVEFKKCDEKDWKTK